MEVHRGQIDMMSVAEDKQPAMKLAIG